MRKINVSKEKERVNQSLVQKGLMPRVEKFFASEQVQMVIQEQFDLNLKAMRDSVKSLPECYREVAKQMCTAKGTEKDGYVDTAHARFKIFLNDSIDKLAMFMPVDDVLAVLVDEGQNNDRWLASFKNECQMVSEFVMEDFKEKLLMLCMPRSKNKRMLKALVEAVTGETITQSQVDELWFTHVVAGVVYTGIFR